MRTGSFLQPGIYKQRKAKLYLWLRLDLNSQCFLICACLPHKAGRIIGKAAHLTPGLKQRCQSSHRGATCCSKRAALQRKFNIILGTMHLLITLISAKLLCTKERVEPARSQKSTKLSLWRQSHVKVEKSYIIGGEKTANTCEKKHKKPIKLMNSKNYLQVSCMKQRSHKCFLSKATPNPRDRLIKTVKNCVLTSKPLHTGGGRIQVCGTRFISPSLQALKGAWIGH